MPKCGDTKKSVKTAIFTDYTPNMKMAILYNPMA